MKTQDRDLLVLVRDELMSSQFIEQELEQLNEMLIQFETMDKFCTVHEIFDLNRFKIIVKQRKIQQVVMQRVLKPFQFLFNKN
jgi:hypothetical protein